MAGPTTHGFLTSVGDAQLPARLAQTAEPMASTDTAVISTALDLGALVREARKTKGLSQQEFADLAGVGRRFVSDLEGGKGTIEMDKALMVARSIGLVFMAKRA